MPQRHHPIAKHTRRSSSLEQWQTEPCLLPDSTGIRRRSADEGGGTSGTGGSSGEGATRLADGGHKPLGDVVGVEETVVVVGRRLRQEQGGVELSVGREIGDVETGVAAVDGARREEHPTAVAAPAVVGSRR